MYVTVLGPTSNASTPPYCTVRRYLGWDHTSFTSTQPYCTLRHSPGSHFFYKCITILHSAPLPWSHLSHKYIIILYYTSLPCVTFLPRTTPRQVHHCTALCVTFLGYTITNISPYFSPKSPIFVTLLLQVRLTDFDVTALDCTSFQVHHQIALYVSVTLLPVHPHILF